MRIRAAEWTPRVANDSCVQKSVAASQRHAAATLWTNSRWLEKVTMSRSHVNGETFSKLHSWGTCPLGKDLSLVKGTGWWVTQSRLHKAHSLSTHCLCFFFLLQIYRSVFFYFWRVPLIISRHFQSNCLRQVAPNCGAKVTLALTSPGLHTQTTRGGRSQDKGGFGWGQAWCHKRGFEG